MYILHTGEDTQVPPENSLIMYQALHAHSVRAELHIFAEGKTEAEVDLGARGHIIAPFVLNYSVFCSTCQR